VRERSHIQKTARAAGTLFECTQDSHSPTSTNTNHGTVPHRYTRHHQEIRCAVAVGSLFATVQRFVTAAFGASVWFSALTSRSTDEVTPKRSPIALAMSGSAG
jgi:hypothetical protein